MDQDMAVLAVEEQRGLHLKEIGVVFDEEVASGIPSLGLQPPEKNLEFFWVQVVDGEPLMHRGLDGVSDPIDPAAQLVLQPGEPGVE